jgi:hypothetical protein
MLLTFVQDSQSICCSDSGQSPDSKRSLAILADVKRIGYRSNGVVATRDQ